MSGRLARRELGQHFLHDANVIGKLLEAIAPASDQHFVEIGPGRGALTRPLLARVARLDAIELDRELARKLERELPDPRLRVHHADALRFRLGSLRAAPGSLRLAGNLPYNISSPLLFHLLEQANCLADLHVMLQKEVVDRMVAEPGSRTYGRLSVSVGARCRIERLFDIKPGSFRPRPQVDSTFVRLTPEPRRQLADAIRIHFDRVVRSAFSMRRKRISNSLRGLLTSAQLENLGIDPASRAENLSIEDYVRLAELLAQDTVD